MFSCEIVEVLGETNVTGVKIKNNKTNQNSQMPIDGVFVAIGHIPNTSKFKEIELDEQGFVKVRDHFLTNKDGVFVAGDVHDSHYKQAVTAAGYGSAAALEAEKWLEQ
jgi:thioredoxin reductase (NADPH)